MGLKTVLYDAHRKMGARIVPFGGWDMPLHYGSQLHEHHAVRTASGMFDVSHMLPVDITGTGARDLLRYLLANDVAKLKQPGKALYSCMLTPEAGVIDDLIGYFVSADLYRLVVNAGCADKDVAWIRQHATEFPGSEIMPRNDLAMIAVQGPQAVEKALPQLPDGLRSIAGALAPFHSTRVEDWFVGRTGYTGEDGFEVMMPAEQAEAFWGRLAQAGVQPCGLGARDTLRLEAGMNLYGSDMDETQSPLESGLGWTLAWEPEDREFVGREALQAQRSAGGLQRFVGLVLKGRGVLRRHQRVVGGDRELGEITSGGFAPTLGRSIALARVAPEIGSNCQVELRGNRIEAQVVRPPFVRRGKVCVDI